MRRLGLGWAVLVGCGVVAGSTGLASAATNPPRPDPAPAAVTSQPAAPSPDRASSTRPAVTSSAPRTVTPYVPQTSPPLTHPATQPRKTKPQVGHARPAKHPSVKQSVGKVPTPAAPKPRPFRAHPVRPPAQPAPAEVPVSGTNGSSGASFKDVWVVLGIAAAVAIIALLRKWRMRLPFGRLLTSRQPRARKVSNGDASVLLWEPRRRLHVLSLPSIHRPHHKVKAEPDTDATPVYARTYLEWLERH